jgi:hypothetical protein
VSPPLNYETCWHKAIDELDHLKAENEILRKENKSLRKKLGIKTKRYDIKKIRNGAKNKEAKEN